VLTREGAPHYLRDLEGVSAGQARTVIVLQPDTAKVSTHDSVCSWLLIVSPQQSITNCLSKIWAVYEQSKRRPAIILFICNAHGSIRADCDWCTAQEPFKNTAATVMALRTTRSHWHPSLQAGGQTVVIQTAPELRPVPRSALSGETPALHTSVP